MGWQERLGEAAYNSPGGARITFLYEDVDEVFEKKTSAFDFPDADGTYVQDLGRTSRRHPLKVIFSGNDYDFAAGVFIEMLYEQGVGKLEHPMYGTIDVVPFGPISRKDRLKTGGNQAVIEVIFWETIGLIYPTSRGDPASEVFQSVGEHNVATSEEFETVMSLASASERAVFENEYQRLLDVTANRLQGIADTQDKVRRQFNNIVDSVNRGLDVLIADPLTLAFQTTQLIQAPARAATLVAARLSAYSDLAQSLISGDGAVVSPGLDSANSNIFHGRDLYVEAYVTGSIVSVVNNQFATRTEALAAADSILTLFEDVTAWRDANFASLGEIDTGQSYQQLQEAVALAAGFLVEISFTLKQEHSFILDRPRTVIDLVAELYGSVDDQLDFFISSNNMSGSDILELPEGRQIVYYI
jgi:prophage DNA circulation protein